jgi:hypothetical protein
MKASSLRELSTEAGASSVLGVTVDAMAWTTKQGRKKRTEGDAGERATRLHEPAIIRTCCPSPLSSFLERAAVWAFSGRVDLCLALVVFHSAQCTTLNTHPCGTTTMVVMGTR